MIFNIPEIEKWKPLKIKEFHDNDVITLHTSAFWLNSVYIVRDGVAFDPKTGQIQIDFNENYVKLYSIIT